MLSIEKVREILGDPGLSDEDIAALRDDLYAWLNRALDEYFDSTGEVQSEPPPS